MTGKPNKDMQAVLDKLVELGAKPLETLTPEQARRQPSHADAVKALLESRGLATTPQRVAGTEDRSFAGPGGPVQLRIYRPLGVIAEELPAILYIHGGGWVIADIDVYDASPRALAKATGAIVVSVEYRHAPEAKFPAAHDDVNAAYSWILAHAGEMGRRPEEGGRHRRERRRQHGPQCRHQPRATAAGRRRGGGGRGLPGGRDSNMATPARRWPGRRRPSRSTPPMLAWFFTHTLASPSQEGQDPRLNLVARRSEEPAADHHPYPGRHGPAAMTTGSTSPPNCARRASRSEVKEYTGVAHEFFGMGSVVDEAREAQQVAGDRLRQSFAHVGQGRQPGISPELGRNPR